MQWSLVHSTRLCPGASHGTVGVTLRPFAAPIVAVLPPAQPPPRVWFDRDECEAAARARDAEAFKNGMTVKEINAAFGERAGELKNPAKRVGLIDMGLIHLFM